MQSANPCRHIQAGGIINRISVIVLALLLASQAVYAQTNISGSAISFDGTNGYLSLPSGVWFSGDFTVEGWVYVRSYNNWSRLIDFSDGPDQYNVYLALSDGTSGLPHMGVFTGVDGPQITSSVQLPTNQWAHLAATLKNGVGTIYINGNVVATGAMTPAPSQVRTVNYIARSPYPSDSYANAMFDEIRIWNVARTQNQIQASMNHRLIRNENGLVGYWRLDEGSGSNAFSYVTNLAPSNLTSNGTTATLEGNSSWTNSGALIAPTGNYALAFTNDLVSIPHVAYQNAYPLTVMCWFSTSLGGGAMVNKYVSSSVNGWQLAFGSQVHAFYYRDGSDNVGNVGTGAVDGAWHHAAFVVDSAGGHIYLDWHQWPKYHDRSNFPGHLSG